MGSESPWDCTGERNCEARPHIHGCFEDWEGACDSPDEHDPAPSTPGWSHPRRSLLDDVIDRDMVIVWHDQDGAA
jgi:hypothetical protein